MAVVDSAPASSLRAAKLVTGNVISSVGLIRTAPHIPRRPVTTGAVQKTSNARLQVVPANIARPPVWRSLMKPANIVVAQKQ